MKNLSVIAMAIGVGVIITGCMTTPSGRGPLPVKYYTKADLEDMDEVKLPANYSIDNFRKLQMVMNVKVVSGDGKMKVDILAGWHGKRNYRYADVFGFCRSKSGICCIHGKKNRTGKISADRMQ